MSNGRAHRKVGSIVGGGAAAWSARKQTPATQLLETLGGIGGGIVGARMPDLIDLPTCWSHRSVGHGIAPIAAATTAAFKMLEGWREKLRARADSERHEYEVATSFLAQVWHLVLSLLCRLASGALVGFLAGYLSHLVMDSTTPTGLPIFA
jgi:hypothetical protein